MSEAPFDADPGGPPAGAPGSSAQAEPVRAAPYTPPPLPPAAGSASAEAAASPTAAVSASATPQTAFVRPPGAGWTQVPARRPPPAGAGQRNWFVAAVARGLALFVGGFTLLSMVGHARSAAFDATVWWIVVPYAPRFAGAALLSAAGVAFVAYAVAPRMSPWRRWVTLALLALSAAVAAYNAAQFYLTWRAGDIRPEVPLPLSLIIAILLVFVGWAAFRYPPKRGWPAALALAVTAGVCVVLFPLALVIFFGTTDYRRHADVAVVFGAEVHSDGKPSTSLSDRMATAEQLYTSGLVKRIIVSGGVGQSGYNEALVMRNMAIKAGVPAEDVVVDSNGVNTSATVADTVPFFGGDGWQRILAVSQFYHLPRIKLAYQRAGWDVLTVPAGTSTPITQTPYLALREVPAFWLYYLRAVFG